MKDLEQAVLAVRKAVREYAEQSRRCAGPQTIRHYADSMADATIDLIDALDAQEPIAYVETHDK